MEYKQFTTTFSIYSNDISDKMEAIETQAKRKFDYSKISSLSLISKIPDSSEELLGLLDSLNSHKKKKLTTIKPKLSKLSTPVNKRKSKTKSKKHFTKRFNGFTAFRTYYSQMVSDTSCQTHLSRQLAKMWKTEVRQDVWQNYAILYNSTKEEVSFMKWLMKTQRTTEADTVNVLNTSELRFNELDLFMIDPMWDEFVVNLDYTSAQNVPQYNTSNLQWWENADILTLLTGTYWPEYTGL